MKVLKRVMIWASRSSAALGAPGFWRGEFLRNNLMLYVDREKEFEPGPGSNNIVFLLMPFVFTVDLQSGGWWTS